MAKIKLTSVSEKTEVIDLDNPNPISATGRKWLRDISYKQAVEQQINLIAMSNGSREIRVIVEQVF